MEGDDWGDAGKTLVCRQATEPNIGIGIEAPVEANSGLCDGRSDTFCCLMATSLLD